MVALSPMTREKLLAALDEAFADQIRLLFKVLCLDSSTDRRGIDRFEEGLNITLTAYGKAAEVIGKKCPGESS